MRRKQRVGPFNGRQVETANSERSPVSTIKRFSILLHIILRMATTRRRDELI